MNKFTLIQDNNEKLQIQTTEEEVVFWVKKLYGLRKDIFQRFKKFGSSDYDRVLYQIWNNQRWGNNMFNNYQK